MTKTGTSKKVQWVSLRAPLPVTIYIVRGGRMTHGMIRDISSTGLYVISKETFKVGSKVRVRFLLPHHSRPVKATVSEVWENPGSGFGAKFLDLDDRSRAWIKDHVVGILTLPTREAFRPVGRAA